MNQLNSLILEGRIVKNASLKELPSGLKVCEMDLAVNRSYKGNNGEWIEEVSYFDVTTFGKLAEVASEKGVQGAEIRVVGRLKQDCWTTQEGKQMSKVSVLAEHLEFKPVAKKVEKITEEQVEPAKTADECFNIGF